MKKICFLAMVFVFGLPPNGVHAQNTGGISINKQNVPFEEIVRDIEAQSKYTFMYSTEAIQSIGRVTVNVSNATIQRALDVSLVGKPYTYHIDGSVIVVSARKQSTQNTPQQTPVTPSVPQPQETLNLTGRVVDTQGVPLPGASVVIKGTTTVTIADIDGLFKISVLQIPVTLEISFIGMQTKEVVFRSESMQTVTLEEAEAEIKEAVVTGMFTRRANTYTGSVTTITGEELMRVGNQNVIASLSVLEPALLLVDNLATGSDPNATPTLMMRGQSALPDLRGEYQSNPNQPLFILDGFETSLQTILDMDMNLVTSITTLKDATAKAMYGAKAANGVVVVETRRPSRGKMRISYTGNLNMEIPDLSSYELTNAHEKLIVEQMAGFYRHANVNTHMDRQRIYENLLRQVLGGVDSYWLSQPLCTGVGNKHSFLLEGGDDYMLYGVNLSYNKINGVMKGSDRGTFSGGVNLTYRVNKFQFRNRLTITDNTANNSPWGGFSDYAFMNPYFRIRNDKGDLIRTYSQTAIGGGTATNPIWNSMINTINTSGYTDISNNFYAEYNPIENLRITSRFGFTKQLSSADNFKPATHTAFVNYTGEDFFRRGSYSKTQGSSTNIDADLGASYSIIHGKHLVFSNLMLTMSDYSYNNYSITAEGFPNDKMDDISFAVQYLKDGSPSGSENRSRTLGSVGSVNYSFDNRYLFDANYRLTGSSEFGVNSRWGSFWSVGAGWNMHNEVFLKELTFLNQLRLRASTGYTGSQGFSTFDAIATFRYFSTQQYDGYIGSYPMRLANPNLGWQKKYDHNFGLDFTILDRRLSGRFEYYISNTEGMLTSVTAPPSTGFDTYRENLGTVENRGMEGTLNYRVWQDTRNRNYITISTSFASNKNTLKEISESLRSWNDEQDAHKNAADTDADVEKALKNIPSVRFIEGQSMSAIWAVRSRGIDPANGKEIFVTRNGEITYDWSTEDQVVVGDALPKVNGTVGLNVELFNFSLNIVGEYRLGGQLYNTTLVNKVENADLYRNVDRRVLTDRWQEPGDMARFKTITDQSLTRPTSRFVEDYNLFALRSINLTYDFRDFNFVKNSFINRFRLTVYLNDIFTISTIKVERGTDYPFARNLSLSLNMAF